MGKHILLPELKLAMVRCKNYTAKQISNLTSATTAALEEMKRIKADKPKFTSLTVAAASWQSVTDSNLLDAGLKFAASCSCKNAAISMSAYGVIDKASLPQAFKSGLSSYMMVEDGKINFYASKKPTKNLTVLIDLKPTT